LSKYLDEEAIMSALLEPVECCAPLGASTLSDDEAEATAQLFKALGDPARVRLVNLLAQGEGEVCMCDLIEPVGLSQPTVSHHMKKLVDVGLVEREQRGKWAFFSLKREAVERLAVVADMKGACC
jgi:ArsR family transcriptional regulator